MHKVTIIAAAIAFAAGTAEVGGNAQAASFPAQVLGSTTNEALLHKAQYVWAGHNYCFYPDGWHGPGFYWCGYRWHRGIGWGGGEGWHGWRPGQEGRWHGGGDHGWRSGDRMGPGGPRGNMGSATQGRSVSGNGHSGTMGGRGQGGNINGGQTGNMGSQGGGTMKGGQGSGTKNGSK